jgi:hypothetical protein
VSGADGRWQRSRAGEQSMCQRKKKRERGSKDLFGICKNLRDFNVNWIFPLIQSSNEKMVKIEVVELFKSHNFALGLKFRKPKAQGFILPFCTQIKLK